MDILKSGLFIVMKNSGIRGMITACCIRFKNVSYEVSYFLSGSYTTIWVNEDEFEVEKPEKMKIGFKQE